MVGVPIATGRTPAELRAMARRERDGRVSGRLLALANALDGMGRDEAARAAGMDRQTLRDWVHRYNAEGPAGLRDRPRPGRPCGLDEGRQAALKALILRGPRLERDGCVAWRVRDLCRLVEERFGVRYGETGMLRLVKSLDLSRQKARPVHPEADPRAQERFKKNLPGVMREAADQHPEAGRVELWFMDEARIGQKGGMTHVWYQKGMRPRGVRQQGFASAHLFGAVCPEREAGVALALPKVSTAVMNLFLAELARAVPAGTHAVLVLDGAGWHVSEDLTVPPSLTLVHPPPYSPELNPVERGDT
jgi:transposase